MLAAVVLFPLLFDTQPRAIPVDIPIEIPSRKTAKPLTVDPVSEVPAEQVVAAAPKGADAKPLPKGEPAVKAVADDEEIILSQTPARSVAVPPAPAVVAAVKPPVPKPETARPEPAPVKETAKDAAKEPPKEPAKPAPAKEVHKEPAKDAPKDTAADAARAQALLEGRAPPAASKPAATADAAGARFIVQVGAFADSTVAQSARLKLERAGLKTYTHEAQTPEGKRIRVRLGPFATRAEAEKAAAKAKATGTAAAILTL